MKAKLIKRGSAAHAAAQQQIHRFNTTTSRPAPTAQRPAQPKDPRVTQTTARLRAKALLGLGGDK